MALPLGGTGRTISLKQYQREKKERESKEFYEKKKFERERKSALEERAVKEKIADVTSKAGYTKETGKPITYKDVVINKGGRITYDATRVKGFSKTTGSTDINKNQFTITQQQVRNLGIANLKTAPTTTTTTTYQVQQQKVNLNLGQYKQQKPEEFYKPKIERSFYGMETRTDKGMKFDAGFGTLTKVEKTGKEQYSGALFDTKIQELETKNIKGYGNIGTFAGLTLLYGGKQLAKRSYEASFLGVGEQKGLKVPFKETAKEFLETPATIITEPKESALAIYSDITTRPYKVIGETGADLLFFKGVQRAGIEVKNIGIRKGKKEIPIEKVTIPEVISGKQAFPLTKSPKQSITYAKQSDLKLVSATRSSFDKEFIVTGGEKGLLNLEDVGLYTSSKGRASTYFLYLDEQKFNYKLSLDPTSEIRNIFETPKILEISGVTKIGRYPEELLKSKGFVKSNIYLKEQAGKQTAFITKRSETRITPEQEYIIPYGSIIKRGTATEYFEYKGRAVPIFKSELIKGYSKIDLRETNLPKTQIKEYSSYSDYRKPITPYRLFKNLPDSYKLDTTVSKYNLKNYDNYNKVTGTDYKGYSKISETKSYTSQELYKKTYRKAPILTDYRITQEKYKVTPKVSEYSLKTPEYKPTTRYTSKRLKIPDYSRFREIKANIPPTDYNFKIKIPKETKKEYRIDKKIYKFRPSKEKYARLVIPDLYSVNITEAKTGKEAISPKLTKKIRKQAKGFFTGTSLGFIQTEQLRTGKVR